MLDASKRMMEGDEGVFTNPYSDTIPEGGRRGIFDEAENEMPPEKEEPSAAKIIKTNFIDDVMMLSGPKQFAYHCIALLSFAGVFYIIAFIYTKACEIAAPYKIHAPSYGFPYVALKLMTGNVPLFIIAVLIALLISLELAQKYKTSARKMEGDTEIRHKDRFTSADWLNYNTQELVNTFNIVFPDYGDIPWYQKILRRIFVKDVNSDENATYKPNGLPLCMYEGKLFCMPDDPKYYQFKNKNIAIVGISGGGKSFGAIKPMVMTILGKGESVLVTDTKGDLFQEIHTLDEDLEYNEHVFDVKNPAYSDSWNCFKDIVEAEEGTVWDLVNIFADTIIQNTGYGHGSQNKSDYWTQNEQNLLRAMIFYICRSKSCLFPRTMEGLMKMLSMSAMDIDMIFKSLPESDPAFKTSSFYRNQADAKLKDNYRSGLRSKLEIFETPAICGMLSYDGIDFEELVHKKSIVYLITPDHTGTYDVITSLFVTCMYNKLIEISDSRDYGGTLKKPFWFMLDELCNMAAINELSRKISTNRSRNVNMVFAIQSIPQMDSQYYNLAKNILANCGTQMLFGTNDKDTAQYYADRCGKVNVEESMDSQDKPPLTLNLFTIFSRKRRKSRNVVDLWPAYKVEQMGEEMLLAIATKEVMKAKPFPATMHPLYADAERVQMERNPEWYQRYLEDDPSRKMPESKQYTPSAYETTPEEPVHSVREYYERKGFAQDGLTVSGESDRKISMKTLFEEEPQEPATYTKEETPANDQVGPEKESKPQAAFVYEVYEEEATPETRQPDDSPDPYTMEMDDGMFGQIEGTL